MSKQRSLVDCLFGVTNSNHSSPCLFISKSVKNSGRSSSVHVPHPLLGLPIRCWWSQDWLSFSHHWIQLNQLLGESAAPTEALLIAYLVLLPRWGRSAPRHAPSRHDFTTTALDGKDLTRWDHVAMLLACCMTMIVCKIHSSVYRTFATFLHNYQRLYTL